MAISYQYGLADAAQEKHIVAESSLLKATRVGHIASVKLHEARDNGTLIQLGAWVANTNEMQVYTGKDCNDATAPVYLILQPALNYNSDLKAASEEKYFYNAAGDIVRAYEIVQDDIFTVSADAIDALSTAPVVGNYVSFDTDNKYTEASSIPASGYGICQIIEKVNYKNSVSYRLHVIYPAKAAE